MISSYSNNVERTGADLEALFFYTFFQWIAAYDYFHISSFHDFFFFFSFLFLARCFSYILLVYLGAPFDF
jgi:hypothetical protein